jgi:hypothetical protein
MNNRSNIYDNLEFVLDDNDIDYYVIINKPRDNDKYEIGKSIVFHMEPWINDKSKKNGISKWGFWSKPKGVLKLFNHENYLNNTQWKVDLNYVNLRLKDICKKNKIISILSNKNFDEGHKYRINLIKYIDNEKDIDLDLFGKENYHNIKSYKSKINRKENELIKYKYCIECENNKEKNYCTEKFYDAILCECLIFYRGAPNLHEYIDERCFIKLDDDINKSIDIIKKSIKNNEYERRIKYIKIEKEKIINELGFYPRLSKYINSL